jgi:hypothetical protein
LTSNPQALSCTLDADLGADRSETDELYQDFYAGDERNVQPVAGPPSSPLARMTGGDPGTPR